MKKNLCNALMMILTLLAFSSFGQHDHKSQLRQLIPSVPYLVYDSDSLSGYHENEMIQHAVDEKYTGQDIDRYNYLMKRNYIRTKYGINALSRPGSPPPTPQSPCTNVDFETGTTAGWTTTGDAVITSGGGTDPYGGFPVVCPGGNFSLQLGNTTNPTTSMANQTFAVTAANAYFQLKFAMVILNYPHTAADAARVFIRFRDQAGNIIPCPYFECYYATSSTGGGQSYGLSGFLTGSNGVNIGNQSYPTTYVPWTNLGFDLTPYIGQNITVEIENRWCVYNYDWAYCYVDGLCSNLTTSVTGGCAGTIGTLTGPSGMQTYNWAGPAGSNVTPIHTQTVSVTTAGIYTVTCSPYSSCGTATYVYTLNFAPSVNPTANFNYTLTSCASSPVPFADASSLNGGPPISSYVWTWGDGTANGSNSSETHSFNTGTHTIQLKVSNGQCVDSISKTITLTAGATATFNPTNICVGNISNFVSTTTPTTGIASQVWYFGDSSPNGMGGTTSHTYATPNTYTVSLVVTDASLCKDSISKTITIYPKPIIAFAANPGCLGVATTFTNTSSITAPNTISNWYWDFDSNGTVDNTTQSPTYNYTATGNYTAELKATSSNGCSDSSSILIKVNPVPTATFSPATACVNGSVLLNNTSSVGAPDNIALWSWGFGANSSPATSSNQNPSVIYSSSGVQTITLTATSNNSCTATLTQTVMVNAQPTAAFITSSVCQGIATTFTDQSTPAAPSTNSVVSWAWDYTNDGTTDNTTANPSFSYGSSGSYTAALIVTSANGCKDTVLLPVNVWGHASVNFSPANVCYGTASSFTDQTVTTSQANTGTLQTWNWNFGNGSTATSQNPVYTYATGTATANTTYNVKLVVSTSHGCIDSLSKPVTVYALPTANFTSDSACFNSPSHLFDASNGNGNALSGYAWDYTGDNIADITGVANPNYTFPNYGNNSVNYTVSTTPAAGLSCSNSITHNVWVNPSPVPAFTFTNVCVNARPMNYDASSSTIPAGTNTLYSWSYGDTQNGNGVTTTHIYAVSGVYSVTLSVTSDKGCVTQVVHQTEVYEKPHVTFSSTKTCLGNATTFTGTSLPNSGNVVQWLWDFNNSINTIEGNGQPTSFTFNSAGTKTISLVSVTDKGCKDTISRQMYVNYVPKPQFTVDKPAGCPQLCVNFTDNTPAITGPSQIVNWTWRLGDGTTVNANSNTSQAHCYTNASSSQLALFDVTLIATSDSACVDSMVKHSYITVYPVPVASYTVNPNPGSVTEPLEYFINQSQDYTKWWWTFGDGIAIDSTHANPTHFYNNENAANYPTSLIVANQYGCRDTAYLQVDIGPEFVFYIPNCFTPGNGDGINDTFGGKGIGISKYEMWIFDRWGNMIYYTDDIYKQWDGKVQGKPNPVQQDVYVWKVKLIDVFSKKHDYIGHVTVLRGGGN